MIKGKKVNALLKALFTTYTTTNALAADATDVRHELVWWWCTIILYVYNVGEPVLLTKTNYRLLSSSHIQYDIFTAQKTQNMTGFLKIHLFG